MYLVTASGVHVGIVELYICTDDQDIIFEYADVVREIKQGNEIYGTTGSLPGDGDWYH